MSVSASTGYDPMALQDVVLDLRKLNNDIERAEHSWGIFLESVRHFEDEQKSLVEAVNRLMIGATLNHIQMILLHDCVSSICRCADEHRNDRISINSIAASLRVEFRDSQPEKVRAIDRARREILKSQELNELRVFRNNNLGHNLRNETPETEYRSIPYLLEKMSSFSDQSFKLLGRPKWIGQSSASYLKSRASIFWTCLEIGAVAQDHLDN